MIILHPHQLHRYKYFILSTNRRCALNGWLMTNYIGLSGELEIINSKYATKLLLNPVTSELDDLRDRLRLCAILTYVMSQAAHFFHFQLTKLQSDLFNVCMFDGSWFPQWHWTKNTKRPTRLWKGNFPDYKIYANHSHQLQRFFFPCAQ